MYRSTLLSTAVACIISLTPSLATAETVDEQLRKLDAQGKLRVMEQTTDACDKNCPVTFTSTTDGDVVVQPGETKYFKIKPIDDYTRGGGYYWKCCGSQERSRMKGSVYIKVMRRANTGAFDQYWVTIDL
jgi:hypothetical protein